MELSRFFSSIGIPWPETSWKIFEICEIQKWGRVFEMYVRSDVGLWSGFVFLVLFSSFSIFDALFFNSYRHRLRMLVHRFRRASNNCVFFVNLYKFVCSFFVYFCVFFIRRASLLSLSLPVFWYIACALGFHIFMNFLSFWFRYIDGQLVTVVLTKTTLGNLRKWALK